MTITNIFGKEFDSIHEAVISHLDGDNFANGAIEALGKRAENNSNCIANTIALLVKKNIITEKEVEDNVLKGLFA